jgi:hypothetical protein
LTPTQRGKLKQWLKKGAPAAGFPTDRWTLPRIAKLIERAFAGRSQANSLPRLLLALDFTRQRPRPAAVEGGEELLDAWLEKDWPRLKKARRSGAGSVFYEETGFAFRAPLARTWALWGKPAVWRRVTSQRRVLSTAMGLTLSGKIYKRHFDQAMDSDCLILALEPIGRKIKGGWILKWDRTKIHGGDKLKAYLAQPPEILVEWLPA